jgi:rare lipoprotein A (peptidoglycan hydrolase)
VLLARQLALAAAALLGVVVALAIEHRTTHVSQAAGLPQPVAASFSGWSRALAGVSPKAAERTACGWVLQPGTLGVAHPVLPCGAKLFLAYGNQRVLTRVVDHGQVGQGREFDLTPALAKRLGLRGVQAIRWTFARA